ncbi:MAG: sulfotransferase [Proteobacteria bacterium]|nr:sulfotransferase [Pseudomonadota bacterium]
MNDTIQPEKHSRQAPIIIIGAGRSGSTLLSAIFNTHPHISFFGETYFLAPFIWNRVFEKHGLILSYLDAWRNPSNKTRDELETYERNRIGKLIAQFMADVARTDPHTACWGYKEIWNGSPQFETFNWAIYDSIFPQAKYIHLVRNPFRYAISTAGRDQEKFTRELFINQLFNWVKIHEHNSKRAETERYHLVRYEDLIAAPEEAVKKVLDFAGVEWDAKCLESMKQRYVPSLRNPLDGKNFFTKPFKVKGLYQYANDLGYLEDIRSMGIVLKNDRRNIFSWK